MRFIETYKRLDNLCKDLLKSGTGVTSYIECLDPIRGQNTNWDSDYRKLKHYRYIRNQIVHEDFASEENMCTENDVHWLEQFHQRILSRTDPLSLYYKQSISRQENSKSRIKPKRANRERGIRPIFLFAGIAFVVVLFLILYDILKL